MRRRPIIPQPADVPEGTVYIIMEECKGCGICIDFCPRSILEFSTDTNAKGHRYPIVLATGKCANCQMCHLVCSDFAIFTVPAAEAPRAAAA